MSRLLLVTLFFSLLALARADVPLPPNVLNPKTPAEAWNVIRLSRINVAKLLSESRLAEVPEQISLCSPALRLLASSPLSEEQKRLIDEQTSRAFSAVNTVAQSCMVRSQPDADHAFSELQSALGKLQTAFPPEDVEAEVFYCTSHPEIISTQIGAVCAKCAAKMRIRRIPYSFIYISPTTPTVVMSLASKQPLIAGQEATVQMKLRMLDGTPVVPEDLLLVHTRPIHVFISDQALRTFQTLQPMPTDAAGDYTFSYTPSVDGPCRIWVEITPVATGLQEILHGDLGGNYVPNHVQDQSDAMTATIEGYTFELSFAGDLSGQISAKKIQLMRIKVTDASGKPADQLEPTMAAFAQVVGFYDDHQTALRLHPSGGDILRDDLRGGPHVAFKIYAPRPGFIRFFCQVHIGGKTLTAPFGVNVAR